MSEVRYHISKRGIPRVCEAEPGNCPLGGDENHYTTFEAAHTVAQEKLSAEYDIMPDSEAGVVSKVKLSPEQEEALNNAIGTLLINGMGYINSESEPSERQELNTTDDNEMLLKILEGGMDAVNNPKNLSAMLRNKNIPREFVDEVIANPENYQEEVQRELMTNISLSSDELLDFIDNSSDLYAQAIALRNPNLDEDFVRDFVEHRNDELKELPWVMMIENEGISVEILRDFGVQVVNGELDIDHNTINDINFNYPREFVDEYEN